MRATLLLGVVGEIIGGPLVSLRWLVNHLVRRGEALRAAGLKRGRGG